MLPAVISSESNLIKSMKNPVNITGQIENRKLSKNCLLSNIFPFVILEVDVLGSQTASLLW